MLVMEVEGLREIPENVDVPQRVLYFINSDINMFGVESTE